MPAIVTWTAPTGGDWSVAANWGGAVPTKYDTAVIDLPSTETVGVSTMEVVGAVRAFSPLAVTGTLTILTPSLISGELDVSGTLIVGLWATAGGGGPPGGGPPGGGSGGSYPSWVLGPFPTSPDGMIPLSGLIATGGGSVSGAIVTAPAAVTYLSAGTYSLTGALAGDGWYGVKTELSVDAPSTASNLSVISGGVVDGNADLTVSSTLLSSGGKFEGPTTSSVLNAGYGFFLAPAPAPDGQGAALTIDGRKYENAVYDKMDTITGNVELTHGAIFRNKGVVEVTGDSTFSGGVGGGTVDNKGLWRAETANMKFEVPFTNHKHVILDPPVGSGPGTLRFSDFKQVGDVTDNPYVMIAAAGIDLSIGKGVVEAGYVQGVVADNPIPGQPPIRTKTTVDTELTLQPVGSKVVELSGLNLTAAANSTVKLIAPGNVGPALPDWYVKLTSSSLTLNGTTVWESGDVMNTDTVVTNNGTFKVEAGDFFRGGRFVNHGLVKKTMLNAGTGPSTFSASTKFESDGVVAVEVGELRFEGLPAVGGGTTLDGSLLVYGDGAKATITGSGLFSAKVNVDPGCVVAFTGINSDTTLQSGAEFGGEGLVTISGGAIWRLDFDQQVNVSNLLVGDASGTGTIIGKQNLSGVSRVSIGSSLALNDFLLTKVNLVVTHTATGTISPIGMAQNVFITAFLNVQGQVTWAKGDFNLNAGSAVAISGVPGGQAKFNILSDGTVNGGGGARVVVQSDGWLGRVAGAAPGKTTFNVPVEVQGNGVFDKTDINSPP